MKFCVLKSIFGTCLNDSQNFICEEKKELKFFMGSQKMSSIILKIFILFMYSTELNEIMMMWVQAMGS